MKQLCKISLPILLFFLPFIMVLGQETVIRVGSFNIRYVNNSDPVNHLWRERMPRIAALIQKYDLHSIGLQEATPEEIAMLSGLLPGWDHAGNGRDKNLGGEHSCIFFNKAKVELLETKTFWLSDKSGEPGSKSWDAALPRIVTRCGFRIRSNGKVYTQLNTHFDHYGEIAREQSARMLLEQIKGQETDLPVFVTGDLNASDKTKTYSILAGMLKDARKISCIPDKGPCNTFHAFGDKAKAVSDMRIDFIWVTDTIKVDKFETVDDSKDGIFASDHYMIWAECRF